MIVKVSLYGLVLWCHLDVEVGSCELERKGASDREKWVSKLRTVVLGGKSHGVRPATRDEGAWEDRLWAGLIRERVEADDCCLVSEPCKNIMWHIIIGGRKSGFLRHIWTEFILLTILVWVCKECTSTNPEYLSYLIVNPSNFLALWLVYSSLTHFVG